jgi:hypothetical protein
MNSFADRIFGSLTFDEPELIMFLHSGKWAVNNGALIV